MRFKLLKNFIVSGGFSLAASHLAFATVSIAPRSPYSSVDSVVYYAHSAVTSFTDIVGGFYPFNVTKDRTNTASVPTLPSAAGDTESLMYFDIKASKTDFSPGTGQTLKLTVFVTVSATVKKEVPIFAASIVDPSSSELPVLCSSSNSICEAANTASPFDYRAVTYTKSKTLRIGIFPLDICRYVKNEYGLDVTSACDGAGAFSAPSANTPKTFDFQFVVGVADTDTFPTYTTYSANTSSYDSGLVSTSFQVDSPTSSCPASLTQFYFPGDGEIFLKNKTSSFTFSRGGTGAAGVGALVVAMNKTGTDPVAGTLASQSVLSATAIDRDATVGGLQNATDYSVYVMGRDTAGVLSSPATCKMNSVRASSITGFLKASDCFVASALFQNPEASMVRVYRKFRNTYLLSNPLGKLMVRGYYATSPWLAEQVLMNPGLRIPLFFLLAPVLTLAAALVLVPGYVLSAFMGLVVGALAFHRWGQR